MISKCPKHGEPLEYSKLHDGFICPFSICNYWENEEGTQYDWNPRPITIGGYGSINKRAKVIQGEVIKDETTQTTPILNELQERYTSYMNERRQDGSYED